MAVNGIKQLGDWLNLDIEILFLASFYQPKQQCMVDALKKVRIIYKLYAFFAAGELSASIGKAIFASA